MGRRSKAQQDRIDTTRQKLLDAAQRVLVREGVTGVSVRSVAAEADVYLAAVYYHFGNKQELLGSLMRQVYETAVDNAATEAKKLPPGMPRVRYVLEWWLKYWTEETDLIFFEVLGYVLRHEAQLEDLRRFYRHWTDLLMDVLADVGRGTVLEGRPLAVLLRVFIDGTAIDRLVQESSADRELSVGALEQLLESMLGNDTR